MAVRDAIGRVRAERLTWFSRRLNVLEERLDRAATYDKDPDQALRYDTWQPRPVLPGIRA